MYSQKQLHKVLRTSGVSLTGETQKRVSALTGKTLTYYRTLGIYITEPSSTTPDIDTMRTQIDTNLATDSIDGFCDEILVIQGVTNDTYKPSVWLAEDQPLLAARFGKQSIIAGWIIVLAVVIIIGIIGATVIVITQSFTHLAQGILNLPSYVGGTPDNPVTYGNWAEYLSSQHNLYWYVCPKCGAGFGLKLDYPNIEDVPQTEVDVFHEHVDMCLGIPQTGNIWEMLIFAAIGVTALVSIAWIVSRYIGSRNK